MPPGDPKPYRLPGSHSELHLCTTPKHLNPSGIQAWRPSVSRVRSSSDYLGFNSTRFNVPVLQDTILINFYKILKRISVSVTEGISVRNFLYEELLRLRRCEVCFVDTDNVRRNVTFVLQSGKKTDLQDRIAKKP